MEKLGQRLRLRGEESTEIPEELPYEAFKEFVPEGSRRKSRKSRPIGAKEKVEMVYEVLA